MNLPKHTLALLLTFPLLATALRSQSLTLVDQIDVTGGGEIVAFDKSSDLVATNVSNGMTHGVQLYTLGNDGALTAGNFVSVASEFAGAILSVSSVALDPNGRGFGVTTVIPTANGTTEGVVVFFSNAGAMLKTLTVGFHPDSVIFSHDGSKVFVINEGEFTSGGDTDAPGSVSIIDLASVNVSADVAGLDNMDVTTIDFSAGNFASGVTLDDLRFNDNTFTSGNAFRHVEPEYLTEGDGKVYATLQENNAIAEISLFGADANKITAIFPLGTIEQTIDASDRDGAGGTTAALIDDVVKGIPMPDTIASFTSGGVLYLLTANEGDFRVDDNDRIRVKDFAGTETGVTIDRTDAALGRLRVVKDLADPDNNNLIDEVIMPGTRSFSVWNASTGALVADTGSFEPLLLSLFPAIHNIDGESGTGTFDDRSDDKGPEPEAIATGKINGHQYVFVGMERQGAILMYNVDNPANPVFVAAIDNVTDGLVAPESITFISAADSPTGEPTLLIGYEFGGRVGVYSVEAEAAVPPSLTVRKVFQASPRARKVDVKGTASANTARILVAGKVARGTRLWSSPVKFPIQKRRLSVKVTAVSTEGVTATKSTTLLRRGGRR